PFRRESEAATMYHICSDERVLAPSRVIPNYPPELEPIVMRALEKDRKDRFASADEMLRALDALPPHLRVGSDADVGAFVRSLFAELRADQRRRVEEAINRADHAPEGMWAPSESISQITASRESMGSLTATNETADWASRQRRHTWRNVGWGALAFAVLALGSLAFFRRGASVPSAVAPPPVAAAVGEPSAPKADAAIEKPVEKPTATTPDATPVPEEKPVIRSGARVPTKPAATKPPATTAPSAKPPATKPPSAESFKNQAGF
ncbi:MAG TPA: hypothetical protein VLC09_16225, partial [Polyangiaceae bacterium]|nr:hypothetical protein [Polyangiaceae bacterium]